jgi:hypothetical protein
MSEKLSQNDIVLDYLNRNGSITSMQAFDGLGITRLSARIHDLRCMGYNIKSESVKVPTRRGETTVAKYTLVRKEQSELFPM